jgi:hypothetical protein
MEETIQGKTMRENKVSTVAFLENCQKSHFLAEIDHKPPVWGYYSFSCPS